MKSLKTRDLFLTRLPTIGSFSLFESNEKTNMSRFVVVLCRKTTAVVENKRILPTLVPSPGIIFDNASVIHHEALI